jgi:hypothetical protein
MTYESHFREFASRIVASVPSPVLECASGPAAERAKLGDGGIANSRNRSTYGEQDVDVIAGPARLNRGRFQIVQNTDDVTV